MMVRPSVGLSGSRLPIAGSRRTFDQRRHFLLRLISSRWRIPMQPHESRRAGLTLMELIIIMGVIGIIIGLMLPAVRKVREPAMRAKCQNNMKQLALAVHTYASIHGDRLPPAYGRMTMDDRTTAGGSIYFWLLPYMEQDLLYRAALTNGGGNGSVAGSLQGASIRMFQCPSDPTNGGGFAGSGTGAPSATACISYAANYLIFGHGAAIEPWMPDYTQMPRYTIADIPDGTSNTVMFSEHSAVSLDGGIPKTMVYGPDNGGLPMDTVLPLFNYPGHDAEPPTWDGKSEPPGIDDHFWMPQYIPTGVAGANPASYRAVQGYHTAPLVVGLADGSVRGVSASVSTTKDPWSWPRAVYPSDGVAFGSDW
jgi:competence protein ComGC